MIFKAGKRVIHEDGWVGIVEEDGDEIVTDIRWLTPKNEPSCSISLCRTEALTAVPDSVVNMPRSKEWWRKSREFCAAVVGAIRASESEGGEHGS
jgi:hypothetical protein